MQNILDEVARTCISLLTKGDPFFAHLVSALNRQVVPGDNPDIESLSIGLRGDAFTLFINEKYWNETLTDPNLRRGVLKHEMLHLVFKHLQINDPALDRRLLNVALDMVVNQYVDKQILPADSIFLESFPDLRLQKNQTWFYYYQKLAELMENQGGKHTGSQSQQFLASINDNSHGLDRHQPWRDLQNKNDLEKSVLDTHTDNLLKIAQQRTSANAWGNLPGQIQDMLNKLFERPVHELDWRMMLKLFSESAFKTRVKNTLKRPSKRYGTTPGIKVQRRQRLMVAVDTSGSIGQGDLDLFFAEIFHLWRTGSEVEVVECDTRIGRRYPYRGATPTNVSGRGGTDFNEPLEVANRERPDGLIYFTDGYANIPNVVPRVPVLWVVTQRGISADQYAFHNLPGKKVKMKV